LILDQREAFKPKAHLKVLKCHQSSDESNGDFPVLPTIEEEDRRNRLLSRFNLALFQFVNGRLDEANNLEDSIPAYVARNDLIDQVTLNQQKIILTPFSQSSQAFFTPAQQFQN
jgi:hypothetical protein